jgi:CHAT domain-containing protein/Tfp pilus assembly protein PilF
MTLRTLLSVGLILVIVMLASATHAHLFQGFSLDAATFFSKAQDDDTRARAHLLYEEAQRLLAAGTSDSMLRALSKFEESLTLWRKIGDSRSEAITLSFIGKIYDALGEKQKALEHYEATLPIVREIGDKAGEAKTLNNIGLINDSRGEKRKALEFYDKALTILREVKDPQAVGITLVNIGLAYDSLGEKQKALSYYARAIPLLHSAGDRKSEAVTLNNLGRVYDSLGDKQRALDYFAQALSILETMGDARLEAITLNNNGYVYDSLDEKKKALGYYQRALPVLRAVGDRFKEAVTINNIGLVYYSLGQLDTALEYLTQSLKLRQSIGDRPGEAVTHGDIGMVYEELGQVKKAIHHYTESLGISMFVEDQTVEASTLRRIALLAVKQGNLSEARAKMEAALTIIETLRTRITAQELRASYFATVHEHFETYIAILMRLHRKEPSKGYDALALKTSERARARSLLEMLIESRADIRQGITPALLERERLLQERLREASEKQSRFFSERRTSEQIAAFRREAENPLADYRQVEAEIRAASPRYSALTQPVPLDLIEIQQQTLDQNTLLLEYALGKEKSFVWVVTPTSLKSFELPPRAEIETAARRVYGLLTARNQQIKFETAKDREARIEIADKEYLDASARLSRMLLGPVMSELGTKRLLIVGDGILDYIPFAALPILNKETAGNYHPLIVDHEIVTLPSASTLALLRRETSGRSSPPKTLAVIADPVFDKHDERLKPGATKGNPESQRVLEQKMRSANHSSTDHRNFREIESAEDDALIQRLPFTRLEADQILSLVSPSESKRAVDFDANRSVVMSPDLGEYRYVHIATHGILDSQYPELSGLLFSLVNRQGVDQDGFLWAHEVFNLHLPVEMVVLSGCRTGLGKEIKGEGLVGLTRGFMYAGAKRVVVSLWDISDEASAELMTNFYKGILVKDRLRPATALRSAQIEIRKNPRWQAPYYWAAFVIQGEVN